jgi:hypothetical protein
MEETLIRVFGGTYTSFPESEGAAVNLQEQGCDEDHELEKGVTDHVGVGSSGFRCFPPSRFGGWGKKKRRKGMNKSIENDDRWPHGYMAGFPRKHYMI